LNRVARYIVSARTARRTVATLLAKFALAWLILAVTPAIAGTDADDLEAKLNEKFARVAFAEQHIQKLVDRMVASSPTPMFLPVRVQVFDVADPFADCLRNGALLLSSGLLARLDGDAEIAMLVAPDIVAALAPAKPRTRDDLRKPVDQRNLEAALDWLRRGGFDLSGGVDSLRRVNHELAADGHWGFGDFADAKALDRRADRLQRVLRQAPFTPAREPAPAPAPAPESAAWPAVQARLAIGVARDLLEQTRFDGFVTFVDRAEREHGVTTDSVCLRALHQRKIAVAARVTHEVLIAMERCVAMPDAPPGHWLELGFLYRDAGNGPGAIRAFEAYLARVPSAPDAPIIREYIDELRAGAGS
jgi:hypothetical protein